MIVAVFNQRYKIAAESEKSQTKEVLRSLLGKIFWLAKIRF